MSAPENFPPPNPQPRRPWGWIIASGVAVVALLVVLGITQPWAASTAPTASESVSPSSATPSASAAAPEDDGVVRATGCIAGNDRGAAALLEAQAASPQTATGAAEFATAYLRFIEQSPTPAADERAAADAVFSGTSQLSMEDLVDYRPGEDVAPEGANLTITTANGGVYVEPFEENDDRAVVTVAYNYVADGAVVSSVIYSGTVELRWEDGVWHVVRALNPEFSGNDVLDVGQEFTGGC